MPNRYLNTTVRMIALHGLDLVYTSIATGSYNVETGTPSITNINFTKKFYPKHIIANSYNYPTLVGKEVYMFYVANSSLGFTPKLNDKISYQGKTYVVQSYQQHVTNAEVVLYRIIAVRG